jgi:hypothetical protein
VVSSWLLLLMIKMVDNQLQYRRSDFLFIPDLFVLVRSQWQRPLTNEGLHTHIHARTSADHIIESTLIDANGIRDHIETTAVCSLVADGTLQKEITGCLWSNGYTSCGKYNLSQIMFRCELKFHGQIWIVV